MMRKGIVLLACLALVLASIAIAAPAGPPGGGKRCGGFAGIPCPDSLICVDDTRDDCNPAEGDADCIGICRPDNNRQVASVASDDVPSTDEEFFLSLDAGVAEPSAGESCDETAVAGQGNGRGCKPCKKPRRWCACTYNGLPRASCDPCCYTNDIGILICLD